jgi:Fe2+ or Zn2+ uptake regulation protein
MTTENQTKIWLEKIQASGYKLTGPRRIVVEILANSRFTLNPSQIHAEALRKYPNIGLVTIYRTLEKLEELGLIWRVHEFDGCHAYVAAPTGHQHLLVCRSCSRAEYFQGAEEIEPISGRLEAERGYLIQDHWLQLFGICPECRKEGN